jgi:hypothetical protein
MSAFIIEWSTENFRERAELLAGEFWKSIYDELKFEFALEKMARNYDPEIGVTYVTVETYLEDHCKHESEPLIMAISGYFKDDRSEFGNYLVCAFDNCPKGYNEDQIFHYGLSENGVMDAIQYPEHNALEFVITSYKVIERR